MTARVSVVIPNWNGLRHLAECFQALDAQEFRDFEVIFVDDASSDGSIAWVEANASCARIVARNENGGFAKAVNDGIRASSAQYIALLNNDTHAAPGWLGALVAGLDEHPKYDFAASLMMLYWEDGRVNAAGDVYDPFQMVGKNRGLRRSAEKYTHLERVFGACAGAAAYRRSFFDDVGLFDEDFFLNAEDTDLNVRALLAGKRCLYVPEAVVRHKLRSTVAELPAWQTDRTTIRNESIVVFKDYPSSLLPFAILMWPYRLLRGVFPLNPRAWSKIPRNLANLGDRFRAEGEGRRMGLAKRSGVQALRTVPTVTVLRWMLRGRGSA